MNRKNNLGKASFPCLELDTQNRSLKLNGVDITNGVTGIAFNWDRSGAPAKVTLTLLANVKLCAAEGTYSLVGKTCGRDRDGVFHCQCGLCQQSK